MTNATQLKGYEMESSQNAVQHTDAAYIGTDPFFGEEADLTCRTVTLRKAKKAHACFSIDGKQDHNIEPGQRYRYERALVDGSFWGDYKICLSCMDKFISGKY